MVTNYYSICNVALDLHHPGGYLINFEAIQRVSHRLRRRLFAACLYLYTAFQKSDVNIQITITLIRIKYPLNGFNYHLSDVNFANLNKIQRTVSEQQLF